MARIEESRRTYIEELATNPRVNLMVLSERIDIVFHEDESEVSLAEKIAEKLYDMPQLITKLLQQEAIEFLLQCWDMEGESLLAEMYAREIEQLHFLGFLSYEDDTILLNIEAKDNFFFSLKSRRVQEELEEGTRLETILFGMLFLYGIISHFSSVAIYFLSCNYQNLVCRVELNFTVEFTFSLNLIHLIILQFLVFSKKILMFHIANCIFFSLSFPLK